MPTPEIPFFRLLAVPVDDKGDALRAQVEGIAYSILHKETLGERGGSAYSIAHEENAGETFRVDPADFGQIPGSPFAYWVGESIRQLFKTLPPVESEGRIVRLGDHPDNQNRYLRLFWEVPPIDRSETRKWIPYQKGGAYSPFYYDIHLVVDWDLERETYYDFHGRPGRSNERPSNFQLFFRPGLTWPRRTNGFSVRILPCGCVFADKGPVVLVENDSQEILFAVLAVMNSMPFEMLVRVQLARTELAQSYDVGIIQRTPIPDLCNLQYAILPQLAREAHDLQRDRDRSDETTHAFCLPGLLTHRDAPTLREAGLRLEAEEQARQTRLAAIQAEIDTLVFDLYGLSESDRALFYSYALSSARESRDWYYKAQPILGETVVTHRIGVLTEVIRLLITMTTRQRQGALHEPGVAYNIEAEEQNHALTCLLHDVPLP